MAPLYRNSGALGRGWRPIEFGAKSPLDATPADGVDCPPMGQQLRIRAKRQRRLRRQRRIKDNAKAAKRA